MVMGPGENAGAVDVGGGLACAFKVESHNHPSAVEPFQGAATGVGGILRDVFAVGARPIAILDSLRFGEPAASARSRYLLERAVAGIGHYGNSIGVATVGGEIAFEPAYEQNCLVNAMCLGLIETERLIRSAAAGVGNVVVLFGARTGRDGIGGASVLASAELGEEDAAKRPSVQIGDPFEEKKLLECSLELLDRGLLVALQDLGAAGLTLLLVGDGGQGRRGDRPRRGPRAAARGRHGAVRDHDLRVPGAHAVRGRAGPRGRRAGGLRALGGQRDRRSAWSRTRGRLRVLVGDEVVGDMPVEALVDACPAYDLEPAPPGVPLYPAPPAVLADDAGAEATLLALLGSANLASRRWAFEQYDCLVGARTARRPGEADAAVLVLDGPEPRRALAVSMDGNGRRVACDPYRGAVEAVVECAANLACTGAEPLGLTNCLNFGNPEKPHIAWQLTRAVAGLGDACRALGVPVVGGNVSLYNEGAEGPIYPTPIVGMVGELPDAARAGGLAFAQAGDAVALIAARSWAPSLAGSELAKLRGAGAGGRAAAGRPRRAAGGPRRGPPGGPRRARCARRTTWPTGGLAVALAECCVAGGHRRRGRAGRGAGWPIPRRSCSARARARSSSPARARRSPPSARRPRCSARSAATSCASPAASGWWRCPSASSPARTRTGSPG